MTPNYTRALHLLRHYINCIEVRTDLSNGSWWKLTPDVYQNLCTEACYLMAVGFNGKEVKEDLQMSMDMFQSAIEHRYDLFGITELLKQTEQ